MYEMSTPSTNKVVDDRVRIQSNHGLEFREKVKSTMVQSQSTDQVKTTCYKYISHLPTFKGNQYFSIHIFSLHNLPLTLLAKGNNEFENSSPMILH